MYGFARQYFIRAIFFCVKTFPVAALNNKGPYDIIISMKTPGTRPAYRNTSFRIFIILERRLYVKRARACFFSLRFYKKRLDITMHGMYNEYLNAYRKTI